MNHPVPKTEGFKYLDRIVEICAEAGIYTILGYHSVAGAQNTASTRINPHTLRPSGVPGLPDPLPPSAVVRKIHTIDPEHIIYLDGNTFASDFSHFSGDLPERRPNCVYSVREYNLYGFPSSTETYTSTEDQKALLRRGYLRKTTWMRERSLPIWNGEFGPVYARPRYMKGKVGRDQRESLLVAEGSTRRIYISSHMLKYLLPQGMVHVGLDTPSIKRFEKFLLKKHALAVDVWGTDTAGVKDTQLMLEKFVKDSVPDESQRHIYPAPVWTFSGTIGRIYRNIMLAEFLVAEWAEHFRGLSEAELDELAGSFKFKNCFKREVLNEVLKEHHSHRTSIELVNCTSCFQLKMNAAIRVSGMGNLIEIHN